MKVSGKRDSLGTRALSCAMSLLLVMSLVPARALAEAGDETAVQDEAVASDVGDGRATEGPAEGSSDQADGASGQTDGVPGGQADDAEDQSAGAPAEPSDAAAEATDPEGDGGQEDDAPAPGDVVLRAQGDSGTVSVTYVERSWDGTKVVSTAATADAVPVPADGKMTSGTYYLDKDVTVSGRISLEGDTDLILGDGHTLDVKGVYVPEGSTLNIYAQSDGIGAGTIDSHPSGGAAIGAYSKHKGGGVTIHGGNIIAKGHDHCAGIGSNDDDGTTAPITIYGGIINAKGGSDGAGIGGGRDTDGGTIAIYGGEVHAKGGGENGAGIGGGDDADGGTITIWGGTITANEDPNEDGAGIGGGDGADGGTITINGGTVTTWSRDGAGLGGGDDGEGGTITINGGTVTCRDAGSAQGARIGGGCDGDGGTTTITGGTVDVYFRDGAGIGGGENEDGGTINISGGTVTTHPEGQGNGAGIGGGNRNGDGGKITITGGVVNANSTHSAGIGGGRRRNSTFWEDMTAGNLYNSGDGGTITISGGEVNAISEAAFGIGAGGMNGEDSDSGYEYDYPSAWANILGEAGTVTIKGDATVTASGFYAGIGGDHGTIKIEGGTVTATGNAKPKDESRKAHGYGIRLYNSSKMTGTVNISGGSVTARGYDIDAGIGAEYSAVTITGGTVTASAINAAGIGGGTDYDGRDFDCYGKVTIEGKGTKVYASSENYAAIGGKDAPKYTFGPGVTVESVSGDTKYQSNAFYEGSRVTSGETRDGAEVVTHDNRKNVQKYRLVEPCDHEDTTTDDVCWACGYAGEGTCVERSWVDGELTSAWRAAEDPVPFPTSDNSTLTPGWYYLNRDIKVSGRVTVTGDTHLILCDGYTLDVKGIYVPEGKTLYVYGQNMDSSKDTGKIYSHPSSGAGIGAASGSHPGGGVVVHGGVIEAVGHDHCAGIGSNDGDGENVGSFTMYGGTVTATGGDQAAGIGGGRDCDGGTVTIYGGTVTAVGTDSSAGIGGGDASGTRADYGTIKIHGGTVTATGGSKGAGIGGGEYGRATIAISGGTVTAIGGRTGGAGIGSGADGGASDVLITGGEVDATATTGTGIGDGKNSTGSTVALGYTDVTRKGISVTSSSYGGTVTLDAPFRNDYGVFLAGVQGDNGPLSHSPLRAWDGEIISWRQLQEMIDQSLEGQTITLTQDLAAGEGDVDLVVPAGKELSIDLAGHALDRDAGGEAPGSVIRVEAGARLAIVDSEGGGTVTGAHGERGGIDVEGELTLLGGTVTGNTSTGDGGGVYCAGAVTVDGGAVSGNSAAGRGGGIYVADGGSLTLRDARLMQNACGEGGVYVSETAEMSVAGATRVKGNRGAGDSGSNVLLAGGAVITVVGELDGAEVCVSREAGAGTFTSGYSDHNDQDPASLFHPDSPDHVVGLDGGEAALVDATVIEPDFGSIEYRASISLDKRIAVNLYMGKLPEGTSPGEYTVRYWVGDDEASASEAHPTVPGDNYFRLADFTAREMTVPIYIEVYHESKDEPIKVVDGYSIRTYCDSQIGDDNASDGLKALCQATLDYGTYAQEHFGYRTDDPANLNNGKADGTTEATVAATVVAGEHAVSADEASADFRAKVKSVSASTALDSQVTLNFYVTPNLGTSADDITVTVDGAVAGAGGTAGVSRRTFADGRVLVQVSGIEARALDHKYVVTVEAGDASRTFRYSALSYAYSKQDVGKNHLGDLCRALFNYWAAAKGYLGK